MARLAKTCLQCLLKITNSIVAVVGIAMILYGLWMIRVWQRQFEASSFHNFNSSAPWFIYTFLGGGVALCAITCLGHHAARVADSCCLSCYMTIMLWLLLLESAVGADILLNSEWEKDFPGDPTGRFHDFKDFVDSNFDTFKWIGLVVFSAQGLSILVAMALRSMRPTKDYHSEDEYTLARLPLIVEPTAYFGAEHFFASENIDAFEAKTSGEHEATFQLRAST